MHTHHVALITGTIPYQFLQRIRNTVVRGKKELLGKALQEAVHTSAEMEQQKEEEEEEEQEENELALGEWKEELPVVGRDREAIPDTIPGNENDLYVLPKSFQHKATIDDNLSKASDRDVTLAAVPAVNLSVEGNFYPPAVKG